jgi:hypothetical protein
MMGGRRKRWETPRLIVLVRSEQAEDVLSYCKASVSGSIPGANLSVSLCRAYFFACFYQCSTRASRWS